MRHITLWRGTAAAVLLLWSLTLAGFFAWNWHVARSHAEDLARKEARIHFNKDLAFRKWATRHGGVYVPIDARTPPNPGLAHIPERDIETPSGRKLTLMNPAYILRQTMGEYAAQYGVKGKITSLKLINPDNAPDAWEAEGLRQFEQGVTELTAFAEVDGELQLRLMGALRVEPGCLKCHAFQGYKVGDTRGGVSVAVSMRPFLDDASARMRETLVPLALLWLSGAGIIAALFLQIRRRLDEQHAAKAELQRSNVLISRANADLTRFAEVSAHHLMEPTRRLISYAQRLRAHLTPRALAQEDEEVRTALATIECEAGRMRSLVRDIQLYLAADQPRGEVRSEDANAAWSAVAARLAESIAARGARIEVAALPAAEIDRPRLTDLFALLADNALRHGRPPDPGTPPCIRIYGEREGGLSRYRVCDNGPGIPAQYLQRVFEIFERLGGGQAEAGTGIGLAIARRIVESCRGRIWIENLAPGGAMVVFELPDGAKP